MSNQLSSVSEMSPLRRAADARKAVTLERLLVAGREVLGEVGHEALTIRQVAHRAGVSPATAYTYLASKSHLFVELYWRTLLESADHQPTGRTPEERLQSAVAVLVDMVAANRALSDAVTPALLGSEPEVDGPRVRIGAEFVRRFEAALGDSADPGVLDTVLMAFSGALLQSGMGLATPAELGQRLNRAIAVIMKGTA